MKPSPTLCPTVSLPRDGVHNGVRDGAEMGQPKGLPPAGRCGLRQASGKARLEEGPGVAPGPDFL